MIDVAKAITTATKLAAAGEIVPLQQALLEAGSAALELQRENEELKREVGRLKEARRLDLEFVRHPEDGALWLDGKKDPGPYCTACWDSKREAIRINMTIASSSCPVCEEPYEISAETRAKYGFPQIGGGPSIRFFGGERRPDRF